MYAQRLNLTTQQIQNDLLENLENSIFTLKKHSPIRLKKIIYLKSRAIDK